MYYAFIDGEYLWSSKHVGYLKKRVDEDMKMFNGYHATIYRGERSYCSRFYNSPWKRFGSEKKARPELPDWSYARRVHTV